MLRLGATGVIAATVALGLQRGATTEARSVAEIRADARELGVDPELLTREATTAEIASGEGTPGEGQGSTPTATAGVTAGVTAGGTGAGVDRRVAMFRYGTRALALDLYRTGHVTPSRAKGLASVAVAEAMKQGVPPALVIGVMRVENDVFKSSARSVVGAVGLMQIMPRVWLPVFGPRHGWDLENDTTNVRTGVAILAHYVRAAGGDWETAMLRYNGCVRSTVTPRCWTYPAKVRRAVERDARWSCGGRSFDACVSAPLSERWSASAGDWRLASSAGASAE